MRAISAILVTFIVLSSANANNTSTATPYDFVMLDIGQTPNQVDASDVVIDISKACGDGKNYLIGGNAPYNPITIIELNRQLQKIDSYKIVKNFGFPTNVDADHINKHIFIPKFADHKSDVLFVLLPEIHPSLVPQELAEKNMIIEIKRSFFAIQWITDLIPKGNTILNLKEGLVGKSKKLDWFEASKDPFDDVLSLAGNNPYTTLMNIYSNSNQLYSTNLEEAFYLFLDAMLIDGYKKGDSFKQVISKMAPEGQSLSSSVLPEVQKVYDKVSEWDEASLQYWRNNICEYRSKLMAKSAIKLAKEKNPKLVFLTFGMAHTGGIVRELEESKISYMVLQASTHKSE